MDIKNITPITVKMGKKENSLNQPSSNTNPTKKKITNCEKFEINLGLSQLNRGERVSFDDFLRKVGDSKKSKK